MRFFTIMLSAALLSQISAHAQNRVDVADLGHHALQAPFDSGGRLELRIRSGEIHIVGSDHDKLTVTVGGENGSRSTDIHAHFESFAGAGKLYVEGGPDNNVTITVEVPRNTDLEARIPAGQVNVTGVTGGKDIEPHAGDLSIDVGDPASYFRVQASVLTGAINAQPFGEDRGGMFRSIDKTGHGKYKLMAHVSAGQITLK